MHLSHIPGLVTDQARDVDDRAAPELIRWADGGSVVCLHASASSGRQWRAFQAQMSGRYRVFSPTCTARETPRPGRVSGS